MSDIVFTGSYKPLTEQDVRAFEQWLESPLPAMYRAFLFRTNGGHPHKHLVGPCYLEAFYAITEVTAKGRGEALPSRREAISLESDVKAMLDDLPPGLIPIAFTGIGDRFCLSLEDDRIYVWQHDVAYDTQPPALDDLYPLAEHIDDLLDKLEGDDPPVPDEEVSNLGRWADLDLLDAYLAQGHDINEVNPRGRSLVKAAAYNGNLDFIKECVKRGATLKNRGLLHAAACTCDLPLMTYLLDEGLDPNELNERGQTPLDCVFKTRQHFPAVKHLKLKGGVKTTT